MPKITFDHDVTHDGVYYLRGRVYSVPESVAIALKNESKPVFNPIAKTTVPAKKKAVVAPKVDKMVKEDPKAKGNAKPGKTPAKVEETDEAKVTESKEA